MATISPTTVSGGGLLPTLAAGAALVGLGVGALYLARDADDFAEGRTWISQGGTPHGTLRAQWLGKRGVATWGLRQLAMHPARAGWLLTGYRAEEDARRWENRLFYDGAKQFGSKIRIGYDNGADAFRHTYGSASIVYRLMRERGASAAEAGAFLQGAGDAHERDSWLHAYDAAHGRFSGEMDVHNNLLGERLGARLATEHTRLGIDVEAGEALLRSAVFDAIGAGRAVVMDRFDAAPRPARWSDIAETDSRGAPRRDAAGVPVLRLRPPDAPGFPTPIRDGRVDLSLPHARLGPAELRIPRGDVPQAA